MEVLIFKKKILLVAIKSNYSLTCELVNYSRDELPLRVSILEFYADLLCSFKIELIFIIKDGFCHAFILYNKTSRFN